MHRFLECKIFHQADSGVVKGTDVRASCRGSIYAVRPWESYCLLCFPLWKHPPPEVCSEGDRTMYTKDLGSVNYICQQVSLYRAVLKAHRDHKNGATLSTLRIMQGVFRLRSTPGLEEEAYLGFYSVDEQSIRLMMYFCVCQSVNLSVCVCVSLSVFLETVSCSSDWPRICIVANQW